MRESNSLIVKEDFNAHYFNLHNHILKLKDFYQPSRNGDTYEMLNFKTVLQNPAKRCIGGYNRNINIFFLLAEAMWIVSGRRDVAFLDIFNSNMIQFSDDGKYFHAPYGWRLRNYGIDSRCHLTEENKHSFNGIDQIAIALEMLANKPEDRRVVCSIWNPEFDLNTASKDIPCISGNMRFFSPEGNFTIKQVYKYLKNGELDHYPIYVYDEKNDLVVLKMLNKVTYSGKKKICKINLQNGTSIKVTSDHLMYKRKNPTRDGVKSFKIVKVRDLKVGDLLMSDVVNVNKNGHLNHKKKLFKNAGGDNITTIHRQYYEFICGKIDKEFDIHHLDRDKENNSILNLSAIHNIDHREEHKEDRLGDKNNFSKNNESDAKRRLRLLKTRITLRKNGKKILHHPDDDIYDELLEMVEAENKLKKPLKMRDGKIKNIARIVSIEEGEIEDVYDFHVPEFHNALFENGIVVHNCNDLLMFKIRDGKLYQTIQNRSNDLNLGLTTNIFQFSFLGEIMSKILNVGLGDQVHNSQSLHIYAGWPISKQMEENYNPFQDKQTLYEISVPISMDFNFEDCTVISDKLTKVDYFLKSIIAILLKKSGHRIPEPEENHGEFEESLLFFAPYFYYIYKLLCIYIEYKNKKLIKKEACLEILKVAEELNYQKADITYLAINFFMARLKDKEVENFKNLQQYFKTAGLKGSEMLGYL